MELRINDNAKLNNRRRTAMSQQSLVNTLLSEKQAIQQQNVQPVAQPAPVQNWGGKK